MKMNRSIRKILLAVVIVMLSHLASYAQSGKVFITLQSGTQIALKIEDNPMISYDESSVYVVTTKIQFAYYLSEVKNIKFGLEANGIEDVVADEVSISYANERLTVGSIAPNSVINLFDAAGKCLQRVAADAAGTCEISVAEYPQGMYIVSSDFVTYKLYKK